MEVTSASIIYMQIYTYICENKRIQFYILYEMSPKLLLCTVVLFCEYHFYVCSLFIYAWVFCIAQLLQMKIVSMMTVEFF